MAPKWSGIMATIVDQTDRLGPMLANLRKAALSTGERGELERCIYMNSSILEVAKDAERQIPRIVPPGH